MYAYKSSFCALKLRKYISIAIIRIYINVRYNIKLEDGG